MCSFLEIFRVLLIWCSQIKCWNVFPASFPVLPIHCGSSVQGHKAVSLFQILFCHAIVKLQTQRCFCGARWLTNPTRDTSSFLVILLIYFIDNMLFYWSSIINIKHTFYNKSKMGCARFNLLRFYCFFMVLLYKR